LFDYCSIIERSCGFAGKTYNDTHCGIKTGSLFETNISNMTKCPKKPKKNARR